MVSVQHFLGYSVDVSVSKQVTTLQLAENKHGTYIFCYVVYLTSFWFPRFPSDELVPLVL